MDVAMEHHALGNFAELAGDVARADPIQEGSLDLLAILRTTDRAFARVTLWIDGMMRLGDRLAAHNVELDNMRGGVGE